MCILLCHFSRPRQSLLLVHVGDITRVLAHSGGFTGLHSVHALKRRSIDGRFIKLVLGYLFGVCNTRGDTSILPL